MSAAKGQTMGTEQEQAELELANMLAKATVDADKVMGTYEQYEANYLAATTYGTAVTEGVNTTSLPRAAVVTGNSVR